MNSSELRCINTIIVAVDGSNHAQKALELTVILAKVQRSAVIVIHAVNTHPLPDDIRHGIEIEYASEIDVRLKTMRIDKTLPDENQYARTVLAHSKKINNVLNTLAGENIVNRALRYLNEQQVNHLSAHVVTSDASDAIIEASVQHNADTIIIGCRGTGKLQGLVLGSVSQAVAHRARCSVVIVK